MIYGDKCDQNHRFMRINQKRTNNLHRIKPPDIDSKKLKKIFFRRKKNLNFILKDFVKTGLYSKFFGENFALKFKFESRKNLLNLLRKSRFK